MLKAPVDIKNLILICFIIPKHQQRMRKPSFLDFQYNLSKFSRKPSRLFSSSNRQDSSLSPTFQLNLDETRRVFNKFDSDKDGKISKQEYKAILRALGKKEEVIEDVSKIFQVADLNGDGFIDFKEFVEVQKGGGGVKTMEIQCAFRTFDLNGDGKISADEVLQVLTRLGESCTLDDCRRMVRAVDVDGDGMVDMDEFMTMMTRTLKLC